MEYEKRGYLNETFKIFHLRGQEEEVGFHYHDFDKVLIFLNGDVDYMIEGRTYHLMPYDIVLVNHHHIHRPVVQNQASYERIIIYFSPGFISSYQTPEYDLNQCFLQAMASHSNVLRIKGIKKSRLFQIITNLEHAATHPGFANVLYCHALFLEFMIILNRASMESELEYLSDTGGNQKILEILDYIHSHLSEPLTANSLSNGFYISKYHMMRLFKQETGYTINTYISEKRILSARDQLAQGEPVTKVCYECGFQNYSAFLRAYKKQFGETPLQSKRTVKS